MIKSETRSPVGRTEYCLDSTRQVCEAVAHQEEPAQNKDCRLLIFFLELGGKYVANINKTTCKLLQIGIFQYLNQIQSIGLI